MHVRMLDMSPSLSSGQIGQPTSLACVTTPSAIRARQSQRPVTLHDTVRVQKANDAGRWMGYFERPLDPDLFPLSARNYTMGPHYNQLVTQITTKAQISP